MNQEWKSLRVAANVTGADGECLSLARPARLNWRIIEIPIPLFQDSRTAPLCLCASVPLPLRLSIRIYKPFMFEFTSIFWATVSSSPTRKPLCLS